MIKKFIQIRNVGRFRNYSSRGDVTFRKLTLVFAENGRGKTTLCAIFRSLQTGQPEFILERKTLGTDGAPIVKMRIDGEIFTFSDEAVWSNTYSDILIFDPDFVHRNVYAGDYVGHEHKKNLYRVIVGEEGAKLAEKIDRLDSEIRDISADIRDKKNAVLRTIPNGTTIEQYLKWEPIADVDDQIDKKEAELTNRRRILERNSEIQSKSFLTKIELPQLPNDFEAILTKRLEDVVADAEMRVRQQIHTHNMGDEGEPWLFQGLDYIVNDKCPFCGQDISENELIAAYQSYFNDAYQELKKEVALLPRIIDKAIEDASISEVERVISNNLALVEFWKQFADVNLPEFPIADIREKYSKLREIALDLATKKQRSPVEPVIPGEDFRSAYDEVKRLQNLVQTYNEAVDTCNGRIKKAKDAVEVDTDIQTLQREIENLRARKKRFEPDVVRVCEEYEDALKRKKVLEEKKVQVRRQLDQYCEEVLKKYESSINHYLDQFNTGFRIVNTKHNYRGGTPSSQFQIEINNEAINLGDPGTSPGVHCFRTTLSSGDRSALAFAFFLSALERDPDISGKVVVLDDPFTSQDRFRRTCTQQIIRSLAERMKQVIVLSHDPHFLRFIWEGYHGEVKTLQLLRSGNNTVIAEWDIEVETQSQYMKNYSILLNYYRERKGNPIDVARTIRPFLEGLLRARFPGRFNPNEWLGDMIKKIRECGEQDGLANAKADLEELEAINEFSRKYHHDQNPNA
ncbi:MAG: AAA family ATPase, partial [Deltaproteobacteria bacterium]|nr:AAA family ATPase [Deltaproteobacteria bacterium]